MRVVLLLISTVLLFQTGTDRVEEKRADLDTLTTAFEEGFDIDTWEVVFLETLSENDWENLAQKLEIDHKVTTMDQKLVQHETFIPMHSDSPVDYKVHAIIPNNNQGDIRIQTVLSGKEWNRQVRAYYDNLTNYLQVHFNLQFSETYTCIKLNGNGIMNVGFYVNHALDNLKILHKVEQTDNVEISVYDKNMYGYSELLKNKINVDNTAMNVQLTIKNKTDDTKQVIIGTPIILNEY